MLSYENNTYVITVISTLCPFWLCHHLAEDFTFLAYRIRISEILPSDCGIYCYTHSLFRLIICSTDCCITSIYIDYFLLSFIIFLIDLKNESRYTCTDFVLALYLISLLSELICRANKFKVIVKTEVKCHVQSVHVLSISH